MQFVAHIFRGLASPWLILWQHRNLLNQLSVRAVSAKYKGSSIGVLWAILLPLMMLGIYAFIFGEVFRSRWVDVRVTDTVISRIDYALILYVGLVVFNWLAECLAKTPLSILSNASYVKRVVFPLEILPVVPVVVGGFQFLMSLIVFVIFFSFSSMAFSMHWLAMPLLLLPYMVCLVGLAWFIAALGVYFRDLEQMIPALTSVLMFLSPVFYSIQAMPENFRPLLLINPLTFVLEPLRDLLFWHRLPSMKLLLVLMGSSLAIFHLGYFSFRKLRGGFADVL